MKEIKLPKGTAVRIRAEREGSGGEPEEVKRCCGTCEWYRPENTEKPCIKEYDPSACMECKNWERCGPKGEPRTNGNESEAIQTEQDDNAYAIGGCDFSATTDFTAEALLVRKPNDPAEKIWLAGEGVVKKETVYLAGKITGDSHYCVKFVIAQEELEAEGYIVVNPAMLPGAGFSHEAYMRICEAMLAECGAVCFLPDWKESRGATYEYGRAAALGKRIFFFDEWKEAMPE